MDERNDDTDPPQEPTPAEPAVEQPPRRYENVSTGRRALWVVGGAAGTYLIVRGLYGVITGEDQEP